jgi:AraC-like DNA-binding protein
MTRGGHPIAMSLDWTAFSVLRGGEADELDLPNLMRLFRTERDVFSDLRIDSKIDDLLLRLLQLRGRSLLVSKYGSHDSGIAAVASLIRDNLHRHVPIAELARAAATSESSVNRQFKKYFGTTPARFANKVRIAEAKRQLRKSLTPIEALAFELGFSDASHFGRTFRKTTGETPAGYRKRRQRPPSMLS